MANQDKPPVYTFHFFPFSLYSLMVRFGFVLGDHLNPGTAPTILIRLVNLQTKENLSEPYLTRISPKGQVPVLTSPALTVPIDESHDISKWLCHQQPELLPEQHRERIDHLLGKLYDFQATALSITPDERSNGIPNQAAALLENPALSTGHRRALEIKSVFHDSQYSRTVEPDNIAHVENQARDFMQGLASILQENSSGCKEWIFGNQPTILDAHATVLAARMMDLGRLDLVPDTVRAYALSVMKLEVWEKVTHGRPTIWNASLGPVADLNPL
ncbi:hypothetical protein QQS21_002807 [Conoideocrella luteorostrata]|uniref:GST N-terminal domain-containing protein n=1 Tax=Conoideocrella luteorostrata TaxID=1105319 RepID=A0AAJ0CUI5_9HYPO|nr:hypothetical protein QQS21_002807 [Conoideocrella luteorostrata]